MPKATKLNKDQEKAIKHKTGPLLVVAGAGTGKTRVITERIRHLVENEKTSPSNILALTFTEKAAGEMLERIGDVMPLGYEEPWVYTFHAFADRLLKAEGIEIGLDPSYKILATPQQWLLLRKNLFKFNLKYFRPLGNPTKFISAILKFISRLQDENITPQVLTDFVNKHDFTETNDKDRWQELAHIYTEYQNLKLQNSKLDFGDLITWVLKLFEERPNILKKYQKQFKHVLVDEFQDTNYAQYELVKKLFPTQVNEKMSSGSDRSLVVVGDDSQSIYKFRGAAVSNILEFMKDFPQAQMVTLLENYRSTQKILDPTYKLIQNNNPDTLESKLGISKELTSKISKTGPDPIITLTPTLETEVEFVISKIYEILAKEPQYTYKDFAILARANNHLDQFVMALRQHGIPYQLLGNRGLYDRDEIRDLMSILKVILNSNDNISFYRALNIESFNLSFSTITQVLSDAATQKTNICNVAKASTEATLMNFCQTIEKFQQKLTKSSPAEFVYELVHEVNYLDQFLKEESIENQLAIKNLDLFLDIIKRFEVEFRGETRELPTVVDFVEYMELMVEAGENPGQAEIEDIDTVNLLTVHASKGLEFPVVFMVNLTSDRFPARDRRDTIEIPDELIKETLPSGNEHIQEERRLFYVGMTRAQKYLYMTLGKNYGGKRDKLPSGFLEETGLETHEITNIEVQDSQQNSLFGIGTSYRDKKNSPIKDFKPAFLSYSQIDTYNTCPLQYKYRYVLRIPSMPSHALSFGTTIHDTLRDFHQMQMFKDVTLEELNEIYQKNWQPLGYMSEEHRQLYFDNGKNLLVNYYNKHKDEKIKHFALEKSFNIRVNGTKFFGRIDRIDPLADGSIEIIDYKTGTPKTQADVDKDMQVAVYAIAAKEALGLEPKVMSLYFVESGEKISTTRTQEQLQETKIEIAATVDEINKGNFDAKPGMHCNWCDYKSICPYAYKG